MKRYITYFKYVVKHKWFVLVASFKIRASLYLGIIHDLSKFKPSEFIPYAKTFYNSDGKKQYIKTSEFNLAWNYHQKTNKHHYQFWILTEDSGQTICLPMPDKYIYEMVADWMGAGRTITGKWEVKEWYYKNKDKIKLHDETRLKVENILKES